MHLNEWKLLLRLLMAVIEYLLERLWFGNSMH